MARRRLAVVAATALVLGACGGPASTDASLNPPLATQTETSVPGFEPTPVEEEPCQFGASGPASPHEPVAAGAGAFGLDVGPAPWDRAPAVALPADLSGLGAEWTTLLETCGNVVECSLYVPTALTDGSYRVDGEIVVNDDDNIELRFVDDAASRTVTLVTSAHRRDVTAEALAFSSLNVDDHIYTDGSALQRDDTTDRILIPGEECSYGIVVSDADPALRVALIESFRLVEGTTPASVSLGQLPGMARYFAGPQGPVGDFCTPPEPATGAIDLVPQWQVEDMRSVEISTADQNGQIIDKATITVTVVADGSHSLLWEQEVPVNSLLADLGIDFRNLERLDRPSTIDAVNYRLDDDGTITMLDTFGVDLNVGDRIRAVEAAAAAAGVDEATVEGALANAHWARPNRSGALQELIELYHLGHGWMLEEFAVDAVETTFFDQPVTVLSAITDAHDANDCVRFEQRISDLAPGELVDSAAIGATVPEVRIVSQLDPASLWPRSVVRLQVVQAPDPVGAQVAIIDLTPADPLGG